MCGNKTPFFDLDDIFKGSVKLGNDTRLNVMGKN